MRSIEAPEQGGGATRQGSDAPDAHFLLLPLPEFSMLAFGGFVDKLRFTADEEDYSRQRFCSWQVLGLAPGAVASSSGIAVQIQQTAERIRYADFDYLVVFGGRSASATQALAPAYRTLLRTAAGQGVKVVCIDNASFLLAACGVLNDHKVVVHWRHEAEFRASFPRIELVTGQIYCVDGNIISCAGGSATIDLAVALLTASCGRSKALKGLSDMLVDETRHSLHQLKSLDREAIATPRTARAVALMRSWLSGSKSVDELAALIGISRRQLDRLFIDYHQLSASQYWSEMRLQHVRWRLLNSSHSLAQIADEVGASDSRHLAKRFRQRFGMTPSALRKAGG